MNISERYSRQIMLPEIGIDGQRKLCSASVLIVGLGGLGSPVALYLTAAGVATIGLCDKDTVSISNLQRQILYSELSEGLPKTDVAARRLSGLSSHTKFELWSDGLTPENAADIIGAYDLVVDCTDNHATRFLIDDTSAALGKPWVYGAINEFEGRVSTFGIDGFRYSDLYPDRALLSAMPHAAGAVLGPLPGLVGAIQAAEVMKLLCGFSTNLVGRLLMIDLKSLTFNAINL
ncbi:MAG: HesA/MoeB/ThiF family protein [Muribaculaceae bacterium]|nr:HesA/MoeB/ThiF family protein [Muribaculaceae bacterium]